MLKGRLGLETGRIPHADRHGLLWLSRGRLHVEDGTLHFVTSGGDLEPGDYAIPFQMVSLVLLGPGSTVSHDALRLLARHGTGLIAVGDKGVRFYASMPFGPDSSDLARSQVGFWADQEGRMKIVRRMYAMRMGEDLGPRDLNALRGIEGSRVKETYARLAEQFGVPWRGRRYDRSNPQWNDIPNDAINHAATAVEAAAMIAVASTGTIPQLGFIHEASGLAFCLDIADLSREEFTLPIAFAAARDAENGARKPLEGMVRRLAGRTFREKGLIPKMITSIKELFHADDGGGDE